MHQIFPLQARTIAFGKLSESLKFYFVISSRTSPCFLACKLAEAENEINWKEGGEQHKKSRQKGYN